VLPPSGLTKVIVVAAGADAEEEEPLRVFTLQSPARHRETTVEDTTQVDRYAHTHGRMHARMHARTYTHTHVTARCCASRLPDRSGNLPGNLNSRLVLTASESAPIANGVENVKLILSLYHNR